MPKDYYIKTDELFINPYHFIPLDKSCEKTNSINDLESKNDLVTGWVECELHTLSPIFIPNSTNDDIYEIKNIKGEKIPSFDFFSYENLTKKNHYETEEPVIAGSEIRGVIRTIFEALTNSCLSTLDEEIIKYRRTTEVGEAGILYKENGKWYIQPCERWGAPFQDLRNIRRISNISTFKEGERIYARKSHRKYKNRIPYVTDISREYQEGYEEGYIHFGEHFGDKERDRRHFESILFEDKKKIPIEIDEKMIELFLKNIKLYRNNSINILKKKGFHHGYPRMPKNMEELNQILQDKNRKLPVFYTQHTYYDKKQKIYINKTYLNPGMIGREVYFRSLKKIVQSYKPCTSDNELCPACLLFGFISEQKKNNALGSRIRFTDAEYIKSEKKLFLDPFILPELSTPKLSSTEFYLNQPQSNSNNYNAHLWNYDYAGYWTNEFKDFKKYIPEIKGRKLYWHHKFNPQISIPKNSADLSDRNRAIRPVNKEVSFEFKIYFNNITNKELKKLLWTLDFGGKRGQGHKIGMGKPLGLGSISIEIKAIKFREFTINKSTLTYDIISQKQLLEDIHNIHEPWNELLDCDFPTYNKILKITNWEEGFSNNNICYPNNSNDKENFKWFMLNKTFREDATAFRWIIDQKLPDIETPELKKYKRLNPNDRITGKIKWFNERKGYGNIEVPNGMGDIFIHIKSVLNCNTLEVGEEVEFEVRPSNKRLCNAVNVRKL
ncbi:MAG: putative CRISPR-associated RAMP family protein [Promethearchaeota archaeon]|nr:MAG: putative CRISPR-associated RAMP family protein [Candidatus Lokiarchaeota archaeon]